MGFQTKTTALPQESYSPIQYSPVTPISRSEAAAHYEDFNHYYELLKKALRRNNRVFGRRKEWTVSYCGGILYVMEGLQVKANPSVAEAIQMSNIYYLFKTYDSNTDFDCVAKFAKYLRKEGIPTIVQAVHTGNTPPFDKVG
jgi:hypothetical protein